MVLHRLKVEFLDPAINELETCRRESEESILEHYRINFVKSGLTFPSHLNGKEEIVRFLQAASIALEQDKLPW